MAAEPNGAVAEVGDEAGAAAAATAAFENAFHNWLRDPDLNWTGSTMDARRWCEENEISSMDVLAQRWEAFCDNLGVVRRFPRQRVEKTSCSHAQLEAQVAANQMICVLQDDVPKFFGPPDGLYTVSRLIGSGVSANVYECVRDGQKFAVKVIPLAAMKLQPNFEELLATLRRETEILFRLRHERIVSLYAAHETDDYLFFVMELVEGGELYKHVAASRLSEDDVRRVFLQLVEALTYIHGQQVVHRDLKLENILVCREPPAGAFEVKVADFGVSKIIQEGMSTAQSAVGTPQYWAPEVKVAPSAAGYRFSVDLWSMGVVLYVMLEGAYPFDGEQMTDQIRRGDVRFGAESRTSPEARDLIGQLIQVDHRRRISLSGCLEHAWCRAASEAQASSAPQAVAPAASKGGRKGGGRAR